MKITGFKGCCTAKICHDFGGTDLSEGITGEISRERIRGWLTVKIVEHTGSNCLTVITNSEQKTANSVLLELGFKHSKWMSKMQHSESKIRLWWREP